MVDYGTDQLGEWSTHSSEGDTDTEAEGEEEEEEEEEEAGALVEEERASMRLRSRATNPSKVLMTTSVVLPAVLVQSSRVAFRPRPP